MTKTSCVGSHVQACVLVSHGMVVWLMFFIFFINYYFGIMFYVWGLVITCLSTIWYKLGWIVTINGTHVTWKDSLCLWSCLFRYTHIYVHPIYIVRPKYLYTNLLRGWADPLRRISYKITLTYRYINKHTRFWPAL